LDAVIVAVVPVVLVVVPLVPPVLDLPLVLVVPCGLPWVVGGDVGFGACDACGPCVVEPWLVAAAEPCPLAVTVCEAALGGCRVDGLVFGPTDPLAASGTAPKNNATPAATAVRSNFLIPMANPSDLITATSCPQPSGRP